MNKQNRLRFCAMLLLAVAMHATTDSADGAHQEWLNAKDCGASGSKYETIASTEAGSSQITVADAGDFEVGQGIMVSKANIQYLPIKL